MKSEQPAPTGPFLLFCLALLTIIWFATIGHNALVRPDEGRYAEIPREMLTTGNWITPRLDGLKYFEKPALQYWATALAYQAFGEHEWTARLWSALTGFAGILATFMTGSLLWNRRAGFLSACVLAGSFLYFAIGHINILDMGVTFFMSLSLMALVLGQSSDSARHRFGWMMLCWAAMGLSMLSKGLIGIVLPGAVLVIYTLIRREWRIWNRLYLLPGLALFLLIVLPWFILVSRANPEFLWFFFIHEHWLRFLTPIAGREHPWYTFIFVVLIGILPWTGNMLFALKQNLLFRQPKRSGFSPATMLMVWSVFIFVFFSVSHSKLVPYILPIFPALALLTGEQMSRMDGRQLARQWWPAAILAAIMLAASPFATRSASQQVPVALYQGFAVYLGLAAIIWLLAILRAMQLARRDKILHAVTLLTIGSLLMGQMVYIGYDKLSPASSARHLVPAIRPWLRPGVPFYSVAMYEQTLPPYLHRTLTLVAHPDEMEFGIQQEPNKWIPTVKQFEALWPRQPYALAVMSPDEYQKLRQDGLDMQIIARDTRRVVVVTPQKAQP